MAKSLSLDRRSVRYVLIAPAAVSLIGMNPQPRLSTRGLPVFASGTLILLPILTISYMVRQYIVKNLTVGAVK
jgi:ABC-type glycerol-3-phosphate transport system permease component